MTTSLTTVVDGRGAPLPVDELREHWPQGCWSALTPVSGGKNEHFRLRSGDGELRARRSQRSKSVAELLGQLDLLALLVRRGLPVPRVVPTAAGTRHAVVGGRLWVVTEAPEGAPYDPARPAHLAQLGRVLARYHQTVGDLEAPAGEPAPLADLRLRAARVPGEPDLHQHAAEVVEELGRVAPDLPRLMTHGSPRRRNLLLDGDQVTALLDLDSAAPDARVLDLAIAALDVGQVETRDGAPDHKAALDLGRVAALLEAYVDQAGQLSPAEVVALPLLL